MEFVILTQVPNESPGLMEVDAFYDSDDLPGAVAELKRQKKSFGVYRLYEPEAAGDGDVMMGIDEAMDTLEVLELGKQLGPLDVEAIGVVREEVCRLQAIETALSVLPEDRMD